MSVPTRRILNPIFGKAVLEAANNGKATWSRDLSVGTNRVVWAAKLDGGMQDGWNDYAKVIVPIEEMDFTGLISVRLETYYTASSGQDMAVCVYMHDPDDFDERIELSHTPYTNSAAGYRELNFPTEPGGSSWFWYGNVSATPDTCPTEGTTYTWAQFQADSVFRHWTIYRISFDNGYGDSDVVQNDCYLCQARVNNVVIPLEPSLEEQVALLYDRTADAIKNIPTWTFGTPTLEAGGTGKATWVTAKSNPTDSDAWLALLDAGVQTSWNDYAKVVIPVHEMPFIDLESVRLEPYYTASSGLDMAVCVYLHDPNDLDQKIELSHTPYTNSAAGWRELNFPTEPGGSSWGWYGTVSDTPDTCPSDWDTASYTWAQFQADSVFSTWRIHKITLDYGYYTGDGTMDGCYLAQAFINGQKIPLGPKTGKHRKTVKTPQTMLATAKTTDEVISAATSGGVDWDFAFGGTGYIVKAWLANSADITPRLRLYLFSNPPTGELDDAAANTNPVTADLPYFLGCVDFPAMQQQGTGDAFALATPSTTGNLPLEFDAPTIYGVLVQRDATATFTATALTISLTADMEDN